MKLSDARRSRLLNQWIVGQHLGFSQAKYSMRMLQSPKLVSLI
jgi:hypothetical protein